MLAHAPRKAHSIRRKPPPTYSRLGLNANDVALQGVETPQPPPVPEKDQPSKPVAETVIHPPPARHVPAPASPMATHSPPRAVRIPYFTAPAPLSEYFIDVFNQRDPSTFPPDVQAYLECVSRSSEGQPIGLFHHDIPADTARYVPNVELVRRGLEILKVESTRGAAGIWIDPLEVTPTDLAKYPHYPWLGALRRRGELGKLVSQIDTMWQTEKGWIPGTLRESFIVLGNVRMALPTKLGHPDGNARWVELIGMAYGSHHPLEVAKAHPWYVDQHINDSIQASLSGVGGKSLPRPILPDRPDDADE